MTEPAACAGTMAVIVVALATVKLVAAVPSNMTLMAPVKFVPVIVTVLPPEVGPEPGLTDVTVGGSKSVRGPVAVELLTIPA